MAIVNIVLSDDGVNLTMTAQGSLDFSSLTPVDSSTPLGANAYVSPGFKVYGWDYGADGGDRYAVSVSGTLTGMGQTNNPADAVGTTTPFAVIGDAMSNNVFVYVPPGSPKTIAGIDNTATFNGVTLSSLGMVAGESITFSWADDSIQVMTVPEPSSYALVASLLAVACLALRRCC
ncbi:PEP-CTERM sorting domain-containing protein [Rubellicoccus peritrichatus]|uniref:PEP-CTERM sorting domain-containing protein n=1 Tax=Rubellicoccus peritrichatus TaxID=3080537 RepID=A0AAQ3LCI3_9BACT|nr:PEP-CTERM sorting domain-containing protein [Puniceicoccus sp. CR14]WOO43175.1 PEP-CTERM sorting domain-containing protein [Puniceicoccus sp. CR14]